MNIIIVTDYSIKHQVFDGHVSQNADKYLKVISEKINSKNFITIDFKNYKLLKFYIFGTNYRALLMVLDKPDTYLLIMCRRKGKPLTNNIAKQSSMSKDEIKKFISLLQKVYNAYLDKKFKTYSF